MYHYLRFVEETGVDIIEVPQSKPHNVKKLTYKLGTLVSESAAQSFPVLFEHFAGAVRLLRQHHHPVSPKLCTPESPPPIAHHQVKPWNLCPMRTKSELVNEVKRSVSAEKRTAAKDNAFWVWHTIYNELDTDLTLAQLVMTMTPDKRCNGV